MTNPEIHARIDSLVEQDCLEEALKLIGKLQPISLEELELVLEAAPLDDEPVSAEQRAALDRAWETIRGEGAAAEKRSG